MNERTNAKNTTAGAKPAEPGREGAAPGSPRQMPGRLTFYHPTARGTGSATEAVSAYLGAFLDLARQKTAAAAQADGSRTPASFDWASKLTVKLDFADLCEVLMVLDGRQAQAGGERNGLYHGNGGASTMISFRRSEEPKGYQVGLSKKPADGGEPARAQILLGEAEALGLKHVLQTALFFMTFHVNLRG